MLIEVSRDCKNLTVNMLIFTHCLAVCGFDSILRRRSKDLPVCFWFFQRLRGPVSCVNWSVTTMQLVFAKFWMSSSSVLSIMPRYILNNWPFSSPLRVNSLEFITVSWFVESLHSSVISTAASWPMSKHTGTPCLNFSELCLPLDGKNVSWWCCLSAAEIEICCLVF